MCRFCDRAWLGLRNERWGNKHVFYTVRFAGKWKAGYNQYYPRYPLERINRSVEYNAKTCSKRLNW